MVHLLLVRYKTTTTVGTPCRGIGSREYSSLCIRWVSSSTSPQHLSACHGILGTSHGGKRKPMAALAIPQQHLSDRSGTRWHVAAVHNLSLSLIMAFYLLLSYSASRRLLLWWCSASYGLPPWHSAPRHDTRWPAISCHTAFGLSSSPTVAHDVAPCLLLWYSSSHDGIRNHQCFSTIT